MSEALEAMVRDLVAASERYDRVHGRTPPEPSWSPLEEFVRDHVDISLVTGPSNKPQEDQ